MRGECEEAGPGVIGEQLLVGARRRERGEMMQTGLELMLRERRGQRRLQQQVRGRCLSELLRRCERLCGLRTSGRGSRSSGGLLQSLCERILVAGSLDLNIAAASTGDVIQL